MFIVSIKQKVESVQIKEAVTYVVRELVVQEYWKISLSMKIKISLSLKKNSPDPELRFHGLGLFAEDCIHLSVCSQADVEWSLETEKGIVLRHVEQLERN